MAAPAPAAIQHLPLLGICLRHSPLAALPCSPPLAPPRAALQTVTVDFLHKGLHAVSDGCGNCALEGMPSKEEDKEQCGEPDHSNRRLLHTALERWLAPRAAAVKRLVLS